MKAYNLHGIGDLRYEDVEISEIPKGWALVRVKASGICSSDIPRIFTKGTYHFPTIPGHEFSGIVEQVGDKKDEVWIGENVGIFPLIPCQKCEQCLQKSYEMCSNYDYLGSRRDGGFAEFVLVPVWNLLKLPKEMTFVQAAMLEPLAVGLHAVNKVEINSKDKVAVIGTGMIGFAVAQWANVKGAKEIYVIGRSQDKKEIAAKLDNINYTTLEEFQKENYFDKIFEAVGSTDSLLRTLKLAKPGASIVLMGNPAGDMHLPQDMYWKILRKQLTLVGTWNSSYESGNRNEWTEASECVASGLLNVLPLVSHCFEQDKLMDALEVMKDHKEVYCKVMVKWNE